MVSGSDDVDHRPEVKSEERIARLVGKRLKRAAKIRAVVGLVRGRRLSGLSATPGQGQQGNAKDHAEDSMTHGLTSSSSTIVRGQECPAHTQVPSKVPEDTALDPEGAHDADPRINSLSVQGKGHGIQPPAAAYPAAVPGEFHGDSRIALQHGSGQVVGTARRARSKR